MHGHLFLFDEEFIFVWGFLWIFSVIFLVKNLFLDSKMTKIYLERILFSNLFILCKILYLRFLLIINFFKSKEVLNFFYFIYVNYYLAMLSSLFEVILKRLFFYQNYTIFIFKNFDNNFKL